MNRRVVILQLVVFLIQWVLMIVGFWILSKFVAPMKFVEPGFPFGSYLDATVKGLIALVMSITWLLIWDRQVRFYFYKRST